jgi:hypothetical protein
MVTWSLPRADGPSWLFVPATAEAQTVAIRQLVRAHEVAHLAFELDPRDPVWSVARWLREQRACGSLRYMADPVGADMWRAPSCTLADRGGDCEDFAILAASMLAASSDAELYVVVGLYDLEPHAWLEGRDRAGYFLIETTRGDLYDRPNPDYQRRRMFQI